MMEMSWWPEDPCVDDDVVLHVVIRHRDATVSYLRWWVSNSRSYSLASPILQGLASTSARYCLRRSKVAPLSLSQPSCSCASPPRWTCRSTPAKSSTCSRAWSCTPWSPGTTPWQPYEAWAAACQECPTFFVWSLIFSFLFIFCQECPTRSQHHALAASADAVSNKESEQQLISDLLWKCSEVFIPCLGNGQDEWWWEGGSILLESCCCLCGTWGDVWLLRSKDNVKQDGIW